MRPSPAAAAVVVVWVLLSPAVRSQSSQSPPFRAGVDIVQLDVSVLDKDRRPVKGLTAADFTVLENGKAQPIVSFEEVEVPGVPPDAAPWVREADVDVVTNDSRTRRIVLIVFDDADMAFDADIMQTSKRIANAVIDQMGPEDLGAVTFTDSGRRQNITADHRMLRKAIDSVVPHPIDKVGLACRYRGIFRSPYSCVLDTLVNAGEALKLAPQGRKTLVFVSPGVPFNFEMTDGRGPDSPAESMLGIQTVLSNLQQANVNVYGVSPAGVLDGIFGARQDSLRMFSEETGGRAILSTNTPWEAVPQIFRENSSYYMLAIRSTAPAPNNQFRRIQVKVARPDLEVRTRSGYFVPGTRTTRRTKPAASRPPLETAIGQPVPSGELPLGLTLAAFATPGKRNAAVAVTLLFREAVPPGQRIDVGTITLDPECGDCRKWPEQRQTLTIEPSPGGAAASHSEVTSRLSLPPGSYEIRAAASTDGRTGGVFAHIDVPNFTKDRFSASGLVLSTNPSSSAQKSLFTDVLPVVPTAWREFRPGSPVTVFLRLYQGGSGPPAAVRVTASIRDEADHVNLDQTTFLGSAAFSASRSADFRMDLPLATLEAGPHVLTIDAHLGDLAVRRDARFTVR